MSDHDDLDQVPTGTVEPQDDLAEQSVLGAMMLWSNARTEILQSGLQGHDFWAPKHEVLFDVIAGMDSRGEPCDLPGVAAELLKAGDMAIAGGHGYIGGLIRVPDSPPSATRDARRIVELARRREALRRA